MNAYAMAGEPEWLTAVIASRLIPEVSSSKLGNLARQNISQRALEPPFNLPRGLQATCNPTSDVAFDKLSECEFTRPGFTRRLLLGKEVDASPIVCCLRSLRLRCSPMTDLHRRRTGVAKHARSWSSQESFQALLSDLTTPGAR
jgi:hypothetical protein